MNEAEKIETNMSLLLIFDNGNLCGSFFKILGYDTFIRKISREHTDYRRGMRPIYYHVSGKHVPYYPPSRSYTYMRNSTFFERSGGFICESTIMSTSSIEVGISQNIAYLQFCPD